MLSFAPTLADRSKAKYHAVPAHADSRLKIGNKILTCCPSQHVARSVTSKFGFLGVQSAPHRSQEEPAIIYNGRER